MIGKVNRGGESVGEPEAAIDPLRQHIKRREALAQAVDSHTQADGDYQNGPIPIQNLRAREQQQDHGSHADHERQSALIERQLAE